MPLSTGMQFNFDKVIGEVRAERERIEKLKAAGKFPWSPQDEVFPGTLTLIGHARKLSVLAEEFGEAAREVTDMLINESEEDPHVRTLQDDMLEKKLRTELIQVATVAIAWAASIWDGKE